MAMNRIQLTSLRLLKSASTRPVVGRRDDLVEQAL